MGFIAALCGFLREAPRPNLASRRANPSGTISFRSMMYNAAPGSTHPKPFCPCATFQALMSKNQDTVLPLWVSVVQPTFKTSLLLPHPARSAMQNLLRPSEHQYGRILCMRGPILMWGRGSAVRRRAGGGSSQLPRHYPSSSQIIIFSKGFVMSSPPCLPFIPSFFVSDFSLFPFLCVF